MDIKTLHTAINLRGLQEQSFKMAMGWKGGQKGCNTKGCEIYTPIFNNIKGLELSAAIQHNKLFYGEQI